MGRGRRPKKQTTKTQVSGENEEEDHEIDDEIEEEEGKEGRFFACYLLTSLCPRFKGHTYIGFTVNPRRRIRQHNGEMRSGAFRTKRKRPWEMVLCIYGFPTNVAALQFEWAWQHPVESLAVRKAAATFKSLSGIGNKIKLAYTMLTLPSWQSLNLTVNFFSTKYKTHTAGCPSLPEHMRVQVCSMDELPCYSGNDWNAYENDEWDDIQEEFDKSVEDQQSLDDSNTMEPNMCPDSISNQVSNEEIVYEETNYEEDRTLEQYNWSEDVMRSPMDSPVDYSTMKPNMFPHSVSSRVCNEENVSKETNYEEDRTLTRLPMDSPVVNECRRQSFTRNDSYEDREMFILADEQNPEVDELLRNHSPINVVSGEVKHKHSNKSSSISCEVEVIDVFTPSPCYTTNLGSKKRRFSSIGCPEIIDLTESPIVV